MISPPTKPALSAGDPGGSTLSKVTPALFSAVSKEFTPAYARGLVGEISMFIPGRVGLTIAVKPAATTKKINKPINIQLIPLRRRFRLAGLPGDETAMPRYWCC